ncbi:uncharacterized protein Dwil_GK26810 [Drosophila willistoni]|uniref:Uncharacterized protein n=1 Tax=Drosophila willistoni TaxID=7260 RepID=A0A0Q9WR44_DROWI|nr:uncharacterized protein Dwil_GK26810 [Drosophila willistoni]
MMDYSRLGRCRRTKVTDLACKDMAESFVSIAERFFVLWLTPKSNARATSILYKRLPGQFLDIKDPNGPMVLLIHAESLEVLCQQMHSSTGHKMVHVKS